jgi:hypothetical protein
VEISKMRELLDFELAAVTGAGCGPCPPTTKTKKGNNGFGNGADANIAAPGNSGSTGGGKENSVGDSRGPR